MIPKLQPLIHLDLPSSSSPPALPGLVSSLRPLKRTLPQLVDEAALLRRFTYKNKNQFKGTQWWRKIIEVDRTTARALDELTAALDEWGFKGDKDELPVVTREALAKGLLRLPRVMLIVEKTISVLIGCASILEQLIHSRAFLAFAVVVVSLVARLHALFTVLLEDLGKASEVMVKLAGLNELLPALDKQIRSLPKELRRFLPLQVASEPLRPSAAGSSSLLPCRAPSPAAAAAPSEELGAVVSRASLAAASTSTSTSPFLAGPSHPRPPAVEPPKKKTKRALPSSVAPLSRSASPSSLFSLDLNPPPPSPPPAATSAATLDSIVAPKRARVTERPVEASGSTVKQRKSVGEGSGAKPREKEREEKKEKVKKKGKKRKGGDEIDDIFG